VGAIGGAKTSYQNDIIPGHDSLDFGTAVTRRETQLLIARMSGPGQQRRFEAASGHEETHALHKTRREISAHPSEATWVHRPKISNSEKARIVQCAATTK